MATSLLATKFYSPQLRPEVVSRPRLIEELTGELHRKLILISAPAGFGKTTLVSEWRTALENGPEEDGQVEEKIAWLSLDEGDNDITNFLTYSIAALNQIEGIDTKFGKGALSMLQSPQPPPTEVILTSLINELTATSISIIFVLDDYHVIDAQPIHDALTFLLEHLPPNIRLVIATREDPLLPLARLRAKDQLTELRAADLRFSNSEAAEFLNQVMGLGLDADNVAALETRTEGWIAGLQLAAISLQGHQDAGSLIKSFTGSHRFVLDYLIEEVLNQQSEKMQNFLLQTAVLDRLTGSLCDAVTCQENGQETLVMLEHANLFIVPLDEERRWYRYHHLFADLLRQRLRQTKLASAPMLHKQASEWYEQNGLVNEAIEYALRADDFERAAHLLEKQADALWRQGENVKMQSWLAKLPIELVFSKSLLCIFYAWYQFSSGNQDAAERSLQVAEEALAPSQVEESGIATETSSLGHDDQLSETDRMNLRGKAAAVRAFMGSYRGDTAEMILHGRQALEYLPEEDLPMRCFAAIAIGDAHAFKGEMAAAYQARLKTIELSRTIDNPFFLIAANVKLAMTLRSLGRFHQIVQVCQEQFQLAEANGLAQVELIGLLFAIWGEVLAEFNDLDGALQRVQSGIDLTERGADLTVIYWSYKCLMRVLYSRGDAAGAEKVVQKVEALAQKFDVHHWNTSHLATWQARFQLGQNDLEAASQWAEQCRLDIDGELNPLHKYGFLSLFELTMLARVLIAQKRLDEADRLLSRLLEAVEAGEHTEGMVEVLMLQAVASQARGDSDQAMNVLQRTLALAEPNGFLRTFVDEGLPMAQLLYEALSREICSEYVQRLLAAFPGTEPENAIESDPPPSEYDWVEPLSERELEVLHLIAEGLTNQDIGTRLYLSPNTVKVHNRTLYSKLGVNSRTQAVARARTLGLLKSS